VLKLAGSERLNRKQFAALGIGAEEKVRATSIHHIAMPQLPSLEETLLSSVLKKLPEETTQIQRSLSQVTTKYRTDLDAQLTSTLQFQKIVVRSHERLQKRLKASVRYFDEASKSLKVSVDESLSNEVEELSEQVMGRLIAIMELIGNTNVDGERWPMLKRALGQEGYEVVDSLDEQSTVTDMHGLTLDTPNETLGHEGCDESSDGHSENYDSAFNDLIQQEGFDECQSELADDEQEDGDQQENNLPLHQRKDRTYEETRKTANRCDSNTSEDSNDGDGRTQVHNQDDGIAEEQEEKQQEEQGFQNVTPKRNPEDGLSQAHSGKYAQDEDRENQEEEGEYQEQQQQEQQQEEQQHEKHQEEDIDLQNNCQGKDENDKGVLQDDGDHKQWDRIDNESQISDSISLQHKDLSETSTFARGSQMQSWGQIPDSGNLSSFTMRREESKESTPSLEDHLQSIETTINKYKTRKLRPIPLPKTSSSISLLQSQDSTSVHGLVIRNGGLSLDESLRKFT
jgi:hypothetical protein